MVSAAAPNPGQDNRLGSKHLVGATGYLGLVAQPADGINHATQIAGTIIDYGNHLESSPPGAYGSSVLDSNFRYVFPGDSCFLTILFDKDVH